jgi:hypothetical protein
MNPQHLDTELLRRLLGAKIINPHRRIPEYYVNRARDLASGQRSPHHDGEHERQ